MWNGPGPSRWAGSRENRAGCCSQPLSYSKIALSLFLRTRAHRRPIRCGTPSRSMYTRVLCPSRVFREFLFARPTNALRQIFLFEHQARLIFFGAAKSPSRSAGSQYIKDSRVACHGNTWISPLQLDACRLLLRPRITWVMGINASYLPFCRESDINGKVIAQFYGKST